MTSGDVDIELVAAALARLQERFPDKKSLTIGEEVLVHCALEAAQDRGMAIVDRARFERVLAVARLGMTWYTDGVRSHSGNSLLPLRSPDVMDRIQDGDLDPLP
jgi:hypothetical protein